MKNENCWTEAFLKYKNRMQFFSGDMTISWCQKSFVSSPLRSFSSHLNMDWKIICLFFAIFASALASYGTCNCDIRLLVNSLFILFIIFLYFKSFQLKFVFNFFLYSKKIILKINLSYFMLNFWLITLLECFLFQILFQSIYNFSI